MNSKDNPQFIFMEKIKAMLITIIEKERITNMMKQSLQNCYNIDLKYYFTQIDSTKKNYIDIKDLINYFKENFISYNDQLIRKFIHFFDKKNKFYLTYDDFCKIFTPYKSKNDEFLEPNLINEKEIIINIIKSYLELIEQINEMIINIRNTCNFTTYEAFMGITKGNKYLDEEFLIHFLEHKYESTEVKNLIYLLDSNNDSLISYEEFQNFFIPILNYKEEIDFDMDIDNNEKNINLDNEETNLDKSNKYKISTNTAFFNNNNNNHEIQENINENQIENEENKINNLKENQKGINNNYKEDNNNNNDYEINMSSDDDYDNYCNFYRKTKDILSISSKYLQKNNEQNSPENNEQYKSNNNINNSNQNIDNNINEKNKDQELNIAHSEVQIISNDKTDIKNDEDNLIDINSINNISEKYKNMNNNNSINNFTCGKMTQSEINNSSSKKMNMNININSNDIENYSLSNDINNINNFKSSNLTNNNIISDDNIILSNENKISSDNINDNLNKIQDNKILSSDNEILRKENTDNKKNIKIISPSINNISENKYNNINNNEQEDNNNIININASLSNFIKYITYLLKIEKKTIDLKDKLCLREDVSLKDLFCIFDYNKKNLISKKEFKVVCKKIFGLYPTSDQINLVYKRYDKDKDENLNIKEFLNLIKPLKEEYACFLFNKNKNKNINLNMKSKKLLGDVIRGIIEDEGYYYKYKDDLENNKLFELKEFWETVNLYNNNEKGIDKLEMYNLMNNYGCTLSQYDIDIIFNKIDWDNDGFINYDDLNQEFVNYY